MYQIEINRNVSNVNIYKMMFCYFETMKLITPLQDFFMIVIDNDIHLKK